MKRKKFVPIPFVDCLQIRNSALCLYSTPLEKLPRSKKQKFTEKNLYNTYKGDISKLSRKNISRAVQLLIQVSPIVWYINPLTGKKNHHRLTFLTLTFSCSKIVSLREEYQKSLLPLLRWLKEVKKVENYVWKAEYQKRGQLHYHITTNKFIEWTELRNKWNYIQKQNGYLQEYFSKHNSYDANSTDVHAVYKIKDIESYLIKYMQKDVVSNNEDDKLPINENKCKGKVWGCSENLRGKQYYTFFNVSDTILNAVKADEVQGHLKKLDNIDNCTFWKVQAGKDYGELLHKSFVTEIKDYINSPFKSTIEFKKNQNQNQNE